MASLWSAQRSESGMGTASPWSAWRSESGTTALLWSVAGWGTDSGTGWVPGSKVLCSVLALACDWPRVPRQPKGPGLEARP
jgi:hypothetical protein